MHKQRSGASAFLPEITVPASSVEVLLHVRDYTKGHPTVEANNHPVRHGQVVGVHNGIILNDEEIFERHAIQRHEPSMTVDTEAIFALVKSFGPWGKTFEQLRGSMATAWVDERERGAVYLARGVGRPLWTGESREASSSPPQSTRWRFPSDSSGSGSGSASFRRARSSRSRAGASPARSASAPTAALPRSPSPPCVRRASGSPACGC